MEGTPRRLFHRWTIGSIMVVVAVFALVVALARLFVTQAPPSGEIIGIDFTTRETRLPDGRMALGLAPVIIITKPVAGKAPAAKP